jgi:hypothetical protein
MSTPNSQSQLLVLHFGSSPSATVYSKNVRSKPPNHQRTGPGTVLWALTTIIMNLFVHENPLRPFTSIMTLTPIYTPHTMILTLGH